MLKNCLITGASKGIGRAVARQMAKEGYRLALLARSENELQELKSEIMAEEGQILLLQTDLADAVQTEASVAKALAEMGSVDVLINNAGMACYGELETISTDLYDQVMAVNLRASFLVTKQIVQGMKARKSGHIVTVASDVSKRVFASGSVYCASKYAQDALFAALRKEVHGLGIKISMVYPGLVDTPFHNYDDPQASEWLRAEDVADAIAYIINTPKHVVIDELMLHPVCQDY